MTESESLRVIVDADCGEGVAAHVMRWKEAGAPVSVEKTDDLLVAAQKLSAGEGDLLACSAQWLIENQPEGLTFVAAIDRRDPSLVLVSEDKLEYLPRRGIVVSDRELVRRQLIRARRDINVYSPQEWAAKSGSELPNNADDPASIARWLEPQREAKKIDGFVIDRPTFTKAGLKGRRHTLGLQRGEAARQRFLPPAWQGYTLFLARPRFPFTLLDTHIDEVAFLLFTIEMRLVMGVAEELRPLLGVHVSQRQVAKVLKDLAKESDLSLTAELVNTEGEIRKGGSRLEMMMELVGVDGNATISIERLTQTENAVFAANLLLRDFHDLLETATMEHQASARHGEARPPFLLIE